MRVCLVLYIIMIIMLIGLFQKDNLKTVDVCGSLLELYTNNI